MDKEKLEQIGKIAKAINLSFDGKLNSETIEKSIKEIAPQYIRYKIKLELLGWVYCIMICGTMIIITWMISNALLIQAAMESM